MNQNHMGKIPEDSIVDLRSSNRSYRIKSGYAIRAFMDEYLVMPVASLGAGDSKMAVLSPVARFLWEHLQEPKTFSELLQHVTDEFEVAEEVAAEDIRDFLGMLEEHQFLNTEDPS